jgi:hypothetical protein
MLELQNRLKIWEISSILPCKRGGLGYIKKTYSASSDEYHDEAAMGQGELIMPDDE